MSQVAMILEEIVRIKEHIYMRAMRLVENDSGSIEEAEYARLNLLQAQLELAKYLEDHPQ